MRHRGLVVVVAALILAAACGRSPDLASARAQAAAADSAWQAAASAGEDLDEIVSYLAEDAVMIPPNEPPLRGREAIRRYVARGLATPGFSVSWRTTDVHVGPSGEAAHLTQENRFTAEGPSGERATFRGRGVTMWERNEAGTWECVLYIWNQAESRPSGDSATETS